MEIKVLGAGCSRCKRLYAETDSAVKQLGLAATVRKVESIDEITASGVFMTPALVINGEVKAAGRIPSAAELANWLTTAAAKESAG